MNDITPKEAIANLNHIYGMVAPDIQRSIDVAIKALERPQVTVFTENADETAIEDMKAELQNVLDDERPKGEWVFVNPLQANDGGAYMCSNCKTGDYGVETYYKYCPFCGADMKGGVE